MNTFLPDFDKQCLLRPAAVALVQEERAITYAQLDELSRRMAARLADGGLVAGDAVAIMCERSIETIASMLATLRAGCVFVPIDTAFPNDRIEYMLADAGIRCIVTDDATAGRLKHLGASVDILLTNTDELSQSSLASGDSAAANPTRTRNPAQESGDQLPGDQARDWPEPAASDRAYIMYTSGSTGQPKGVPISHGALGCYCRADVQVYRLQPEDRTLQFATLSFDISIEEIFPPLSIGSTVVLRPAERSDAQIELSDIIERFRVTAVHLATGYWHEWVDLMKASGVSSPASLRLMVVTGEKVSAEHYQRWQSLTRQAVLWANAYGPTETTVTATVFVPPPDWRGETLPIGKPLPGYSAHILDPQGRELGVGETGELHIGGQALAEGYLNRPEQTARAFLDDPFSGQPGARLYRTGDLARWLEDGNIEYAGRIDHQIKVGSYRIEPGEIENAINSCPGVHESLVCVVEQSEQRQLFAYVSSPDAALQPVDVAVHLQARLPHWMMPSRYCFMAQFPKTINGKIDRKALPDPETGVAARSAGYVAPGNEVEETLCQIWSEVLGLPEIGVDDSFISLGGDSLLAVRTIAEIQQKLDFTVSTRDFFFLDTVALLAGLVQGEGIARRVPAPAPAFINRHGRQLYTVLQKPAADKDNGRGILLVPPLANEQRRTQRPFRSLMQNFSRMGYTLLRFDWTGTANSSGDAESLRDLQVWSDDIHHAAGLLATHADSFDVVAFRTGALLAAATTLDEWPVNAHYYWDPVLDGKEWLMQMQLLHDGIRKDTFRFLFPRKPPRGDDRICEFAGLRLHASLYESLASRTFAECLLDDAADNAAHLLIAPAMADDARLLPLTAAGIDIQVLEESNDWLDPRATTRDMIVTRGARILGDKLDRRRAIDRADEQRTG